MEPSLDTSRRWKGIAAAIFYGFCSASMAFANKALMSSYEFGYPFSILTVQMIVSIVAIELLVQMGTLELPVYTLQRGKMFLVPSICAAMHSCLSLIALQRLNIPMYGALKRCTPIVNLVLAVVILRKPMPSILVLLSVLLITAGCLVAGFGDLSFDAMAYTIAVISVVVQGMYQTLIQKAAERNISAMESFHLNCYNTLPIYLVGSFATLEYQGILAYGHLFDAGFLACLLIVSFLGSVMNFSLFLSTSLTSALTTSLVGVMKSVLQTVIGFFTFGGVAYHPLNVAGIVMNGIGGCTYAYAKYKEGKPKPVKEEKHMNGFDDLKTVLITSNA